MSYGVRRAAGWPHNREVRVGTEAEAHRFAVDVASAERAQLVLPQLIDQILRRYQALRAKVDELKATHPRPAAASCLNRGPIHPIETPSCGFPATAQRRLAPAGYNQPNHALTRRLTTAHRR